MEKNSNQTETFIMKNIIFPFQVNAIRFHKKKRKRRKNPEQRRSCKDCQCPCWHHLKQSVAAGGDSNSPHGALGWASIPDALICLFMPRRTTKRMGARGGTEKKKEIQSKIKRKTKFTECKAEKEELQQSMLGGGEWEGRVVVWSGGVGGEWLLMSVCSPAVPFKCLITSAGWAAPPLEDGGQTGD